MSNSLAYNLNEVLQMAIDYNIGNLYTCLPGIVQSFNSSRGTVDVKPSIKKLLESGQTIDLPVLKDVPIVMPQTSQGGLSLPISSGDGVLIMFSQRSIDAWKVGRTDSAPNSIRKFSISDAFAIPGSFPSTQRQLQKKTYSKGPVLTGSQLFLGNAISPKVGLTAPVNVDIVAMLVQVLDVLNKLLTAGSIISAAPGAPAVLPSLTPLAPDFALYKSALSQLVLSPS